MPIECLNCGEVRRQSRDPHRVASADCCARCGYVGWARSDDLTETSRRLLRERPLIRRRLVGLA